MDYEIIGTRPNSAFRVHLDYFYDKRDRFAVGVDPTTGGPVAVVEVGTDTQVLDADGKPRWSFVKDPKDAQFGKCIVK